MPSNSNNQGLLSSWKEIASYLDCDARTCRRWEREFGLPVHRMEGAAKSRVFAYKDEVDAWRKSRLNGNQVAVETPASKSSSVQPEGTCTEIDNPLSARSRKRLIFWSIPLAIIIVAAAIIWTHLSPGQPADFKIDGSRLIILDEKGKKLWDFETKLDNLISEQEYRHRFQSRSVSPLGRPLLPYILIKDLNGDKKKEILFCPKTEREYGEPGIICFNPAGKELWHYKPGRERVFGAHAYSDNYWVGGLELFDINEDGDLEILSLTAHQPQSPSALVILDCRGKGLGEFINWGRILDIAYTDLDTDGKKEILITGQNDEYGKGM